MYKKVLAHACHAEAWRLTRETSMLTGIQNYSQREEETCAFDKETVQESSSGGEGAAAIGEFSLHWVSL